VDPYAKAISGKVDWKAPIFPYDVRSGDDLEIDHQDSADGVPKSVVVGPKFSWDNDCPPEIPLADSVIYEVHVKGFSMRNPAVPEELRGTYAGLARASRGSHGVAGVVPTNSSGSNDVRDSSRTGNGGVCGII
jgi:isoamylase